MFAALPPILTFWVGCQCQGRLSLISELVHTYVLQHQPSLMCVQNSATRTHWASRALVFTWTALCGTLHAKYEFVPIECSPANTRTKGVPVWHISTKTHYSRDDNGRRPLWRYDNGRLGLFSGGLCRPSVDPTMVVVSFEPRFLTLLKGKLHRTMRSTQSHADCA